MSGHFFLLEDAGGLMWMRELRYDSEAFLQELPALPDDPPPNPHGQERAAVVP